MSQPKKVTLFYSSFLNTCHQTREELNQFEGEHVRELPFETPPRERLTVIRPHQILSDSWDTPMQPLTPFALNQYI